MNSYRKNLKKGKGQRIWISKSDEDEDVNLTSPKSPLQQKVENFKRRYPQKG